MRLGQVEQMTAIVGVDMAKEQFDVCLVIEDRQAQYEIFPNNKRGLNKLHRWLKARKVTRAHICLEATGVYGDLLAETLHRRGYTISVVNPARIKAYAKSQLRRNKTDKLDAALIADFCRTQAPNAWTPLSPERQELRALVRHLDDLKQEYQRVKNRIEAQRISAVVMRQLKQQKRFFEGQMTQTEQLIRQHIDQFPDLKQPRDLLRTIPGLGDSTACRLIAELGDVRRFDNVRQIVAYVGLNPRQHQSGKKRATHGISKTGPASLRAALYMPAIVAKTHNPVLKAFASRLQARGLTSKQVIVAVMRKLLHLAYGVLKSGIAFDPNYANKLPAAA